MTTQTNERIPVWTRGDRLRKARALTGLTVREFAERLGVSHGTITNAETDAREVREITLKAWALATSVPLEWLRDGTTPVVSPDPTSDPDSGDGIRVPLGIAETQVTPLRRVA